jgi:6-phosphogluconolactonase
MENVLTSNIQIFETPELLARAAASFFVALARSATKDRPFTVVLSGGNTPRLLYELLATDEFKAQVNWQLVYVFFGDERPVPSEHPASNYGMVRAALLSRVAIPDANVHKISGVGDASANARSYEAELKSYFKGHAWPQFDLVLLGMGDDGHTASLFPGTVAVHERQTWVVANWVERLKEFRITLTAPAINSAANILFLVTGENKAARLEEVLHGSLQPEKLPAQLIKPDRGELMWMVDRAAAPRVRV